MNENFVVNALPLNAGNSDTKHIVVCEDGIKVDAGVSIDNPMPGPDDVVTFRTNSNVDTKVVHPTHATAILPKDAFVSCNTQVESNPLGKGIIQAFD